MTIARKFGVEIEYVGASRTAIISALKDIRVKCVSENYNHSTRRHWKIVRDASIRHYDGNCGELVSPPLYGKRGLNRLRKVVEAIAAIGATVNDSCGLHVHVDARDLSPNQIIAVSQRYGMFEHRLDKFMAPERRNTDWAKRVGKNYHADIIRHIKFSSEIGQSFSRALSEIDRYRKVNITSFSRHGTIEFRQHEGTVDPDRILNWVQFCTNFVEEVYNNVPRNNTVELASKLNRSIFHNIPEDVAKYYRKFEKSKKKACVQD
jgi:hypothetical protein